MLHRRTPVGAWHAVPLRRRQLVSDALVAYLNNGYVCCCVIPAHNCYTLPTCRVALGWATSAPRVGTPWRRLPACVEASSPPPSSAGCGRWCTGTNLVQQHVYAQVSHSHLTDSMVVTNTSSIPVTRMGNAVPRAGSCVRLARQHGCHNPNPATPT